MKIIFEPMFGALLGGWEILFVLLSLFVPLAVVGGIIAIIIFLTRNRKPAPAPSSPGADPTTKSATAPRTEVISVKCPQCDTPLPAGALAGLCPACLLKMGAAAETATDAKQNPFLPPDIAELAGKFPQLEILELIGKGGMGAVYKARQKQLDRIVALKILPPGIGDEPAFAERFAREAKALAKLNHPNIVTLFEFGETSGQFYFLMEFVDGVNLRQLLQNGRISAHEALAIVPQICDALQFAHDQGIVHRDIKPENILLDRRGRVKVADFGLAKIVGNEGRADLPISREDGVAQPHHPTGDLTDAGKVMGTPSYMSPEQKENPADVDHRADIYALGVVFYQMLTGELPGRKIEPPSKKVHVDVRLDEVVLRALEKKPELRYQQASILKTQVETIAGSEKAESGNLKAETPARFSRTAIAGAGSTLLFILPLLACFVLMFLGKPQARNTTGWLVWNMSPILGIFVTTILGCIAVSQIRRSNGKLYGMWLAVFDGLVFPLLALNAVIGVFWMGLLRIIFNDRLLLPVIGLLALATMALVDWFIIRRVWSTVNQPLAAPAPPVQKPDRFWRRFAVAVFALTAIPFLISIIGLLAAIAIPNFVKARQQALANAQRVAPPKANLLPTAHPLSFGPVVERVVNNAIDFDSGNVGIADRVSDGTGLIRTKNDREAGWDLVWDGYFGLTGFAMKAAPLDATAWDASSPQQIMEQPKAAFAFSPIKIGSIKSLPATYAFQTDDGSVGIFQITGFTENPRGVKIRYKLVQTGNPKITSKSSALQFRLVAPEGSTEPSDMLPDTTGREHFQVLRKVLLDGSAIAQAGVSFGLQENRVINFRLTDAGSRQFAEITASNLHHQLAMVYQGKVLSAPVIQSEIATGEGQITGSFKKEEVYRLVEQLNQKGSFSPSSWEFTPPREQILSFQIEHPPAFCWLDLDSGTVLTNSNLDWESRAGHEWIQSHGLDVVPTQSSKDIPVLLGVDAVFVTAPSNAWDVATAPDAALNWELLRAAPRQEKILAAVPGKSDSYFFKTREGGMGLLQIIGFAENHHAVKIRYKLAQNANNSSHR